ncbi:hypothetical protein COO72_05280 [Bifidobacterium callitrichos]|nr:hypothetical protein COO72_05280 [Bifidobacterium callitrichos]
MVSDPDDHTDDPGAGRHGRGHHGRLLAACVAVLLALTGGGVMAWRMRDATHAQALEDCRNAVTRLSAVTGDAAPVVAKASEAASLSPDQVQDAKTVDAVEQALQAFDTGGDVSYRCPAAVSSDLLEETARQADTDRSRRERLLKDLSHAVAAVDASKRAKSWDSTKSMLQGRIDDAKGVLAASTGKVDDEATRATLQTAVAAAQRLVAAARPAKASDVSAAEKALSDAVAGVNASMDAKRKKDDMTRCQGVQGVYRLLQGDATLTVSADCTVGDPDLGTGSYVADSFAQNGDGSISWSVSSTGGDVPVTWRPAGLVPPLLAEAYGQEDAAMMTASSPSIEFMGGVYTAG